jgi:hypothetical protein
MLPADVVIGPITEVDLKMLVPKNVEADFDARDALSQLSLCVGMKRKQG